MADNFDKTLPLGSKAGNLLDNDCRMNFDALETTVGEEHVLSTGGPQSGKHKFAVETEGTRDGDSAYVAGSLSITTDTVTDKYVLTFAIDDGGIEWHTTLDAFLANANDWEKGQFCTPKALTPGGNVDSAFADSNIFTLTLGEDTTLNNPDRTGLSGKSGVWYYIITNGSSTWTLSYGNVFVADGETGGTGPTINPATGSVTVLKCILSGAYVMVSVLAGAATEAFPGIVELATDEEALTGTDETVALTPGNLSQSVDGPGHLTTWNDGYYRVIGTGADGTGLIEIFMTESSVADGHTFELPVTMDSANYNVQLTVEDAFAGTASVTAASRTTTEFTVQIGVITTADFVHARIVGIIAAP
jgi:hypothetical protein